MKNRNLGGHNKLGWVEKSDGKVRMYPYICINLKKLEQNGKQFQKVSKLILCGCWAVGFLVFV